MFSAPGRFLISSCVSLPASSSGESIPGRIMATGMTTAKSSGISRMVDRTILFFMISSNSFSMISLIFFAFICSPP
ncbi:MAG: hypothetical protein A4E28_02433 [Methanocella sp. PtaU1.Bin125]|nr:MAG: hypothetical protein A4E28_02433 [Methanocella sp. PtaU1.Bin125]